MKPPVKYNTVLIAAFLTLLSLGLAALGFWLDPWTGDGGGGPVGYKFITVPMVLLGIPFGFGMIATGLLTGINQGWLPCLIGFGCQFGFWLVVSFAAHRVFNATHETSE